MRPVPILLALLLPLNAETIERLDPAMDAIIPRNAEVETLCTGHDWAEGPVWDEKKDHLLFSDVPRNTIYAWREGLSEAEVWMKPSGFTGIAENRREPGSNGLAFDSHGRLVFCEHGDRRVSVLTLNGGKQTLADNYQGKRFNSPNDLAIRKNGDVYFTDPPYGLPRENQEDYRELPFCGVFRVTPKREVTLLDKSLDRPNGIAFSPDEKTLYVANSHGPLPVIMAFAVKEDGTLAPGRVFFDTTGLEGPGLPDGIKVDAEGNVFSTGPDGLLILSPEGKLLGRIRCGRATANVAFDSNGKVLFLTSKDRLLRVVLKK